MLSRRIAYLAVMVATVGVTSGSASADDTVRGYGVEITTPEGWKTAAVADEVEKHAIASMKIGRAHV